MTSGVYPQASTTTQQGQETLYDYDPTANLKIAETISIKEQIRMQEEKKRKSLWSKFKRFANNEGGARGLRYLDTVYDWPCFDPDIQAITYTITKKPNFTNLIVITTL